MPVWLSWLSGLFLVGQDLLVMKLSPALGSALHMESASEFLSISFQLVFSLSQINK